MDLNQRITAFTKLGQYLRNYLDSCNEAPSDTASAEKDFTDLEKALTQAQQQNAWFTRNELLRSLTSWATSLEAQNLEQWLSSYGNLSPEKPKTVAVIMAGNLPLVGFHDFLSVLVSGHDFLGKPSSSDAVLLPFLAEKLVAIEPSFKEKIAFTKDRLTQFDAVIATGSNNTSRYFEYYFGNKPHIIRKNRNAVAVLTGEENADELEAFGEDIFAYFGMGCRSVSKLYVPKDYNFNAFFEALYPHADIINHHKYANNYDYNKAVYLMSDFKLLDNNFIVLKEDAQLASPIAVLYYERYADLDELKLRLKEKSTEIQAIVASEKLGIGIPFGEAQHPKLWDYADDVDTIEFLATL